MARLLIVGGSAAGTRASEIAAKEGNFAEILVVSGEVGAPYYRPALSKQLLSGEWDLQRARQSVRRSESLTWLDGSRAVALDLRRCEVTLHDGRTVDGDAMILSCGCEPRLLPAVTYGKRVVVVHDVAGLHRLVEYLQPGRQAVIVGGGLVGSEVAAAARACRARVTIVDSSPHPLRAALGPLGDALVTRLQRRTGVVSVRGEQVTGIEETEDAATVCLESGDRIDGSVVVVSVGVVPATRWLRCSGVPLGSDGAILCDETLSVEGNPWLMAAGDVASWSLPEGQGRTRVEHWFAALEHGAHAGRSIARAHGERAPYRGLPVFWTEQHGAMIHVVGHHRPDSSWEIVEGEEATERFVATAFSDGVVTGALLVNSAHRLGAYRRLVVESGALPLAQLPNSGREP